MAPRLRAVPDFAHFAGGQVFARRYQVVRLIKAGGMGAVYEATHLSTKRRVALKVMRPEIVSDAAERARFVQEAQVATLIESAHVVDVLDAGVDDETGVPFLVMEFLVGEELGDHVQRRGRLEPREVVHWLGQAARALDKAHARGVIHRDLKPENLFIATRDETTSLKILDFGIAKVLQAVASSSTRGSGTPLYMAPEQTRRSSQIGPTTDVWALGLIAYRLLVGRNYWLAEDVHQLIGEVLIEPLEPPTQRALQVGVPLQASFDGWFFACVNRDPSARYRSAGDAASALAGVFGLAAHPSRPPPGIAATVLANTAPATPNVTERNPELALAQTTAAPQTHDAPRAHERSQPSSRTSRWPWVALGVVALGGGTIAAIALTSAKGRDGAPGGDSSAAPPATSSGSGAASTKPLDLAHRLARSNPFVDVGALRVQTHEVTREEYATYVAALPEHDRPKARPRGDWNGEPVDEATARRPVGWVTFERAAGFCKAIDARLPTSDEWSRALGAKFPWGDDWPKGDALKALAIARGEDAEPLDVESVPTDRTPTGVRDLAGNVQEWTSTVGGDARMNLTRGASVSMDVELARTAITGGLPKFTEQGAPQSAVESIAGARLGFRCVK